MSKKFLGKVIATAALSGAALLIAPGIALADEPGSHDWPQACAEQGGEHGKPGEEAKPGAEGKPGAEAKPESAKADEHGKPGGDEDKKECDAPKGWVDGGAGGTSTDIKLFTAGGTLLGAASLGGLVLLRRRRTDGSLA
ncbi:hypothetical protein Ais01nite_80410 [Asanoa ishikariensis]|uniref:LPXTG-motif cell wall anchor domain-containing protein n=1 Tax=Asanoa ishikariensis TaxID=137265 RepID=A0A1H3UZ32_9ACTN|nr:hypothetical protein [Asanoa ishikariensis]GIF70006.1 hypothetical protein Ais01nite_80410 [Asanoa ishikariensis]SDZ67231.1 hypothetical protein SAMN05421684_8383 [Asanoa ishikariensis]